MPAQSVTLKYTLNPSGTTSENARTARPGSISQAMAARLREGSTGTAIGLLVRGSLRRGVELPDERLGRDQLRAQLADRVLVVVLEPRRREIERRRARGGPGVGDDAEDRLGHRRVARARLDGLGRERGLLVPRQLGEPPGIEHEVLLAQREVLARCADHVVAAVPGHEVVDRALAIRKGRELEGVD